MITCNIIIILIAIAYLLYSWWAGIKIKNREVVPVDNDRVLDSGSLYMAVVKKYKRDKERGKRC